MRTVLFASALSLFAVSNTAVGVVVFDTITSATFATGSHLVGEFPAAAGEASPHDYRVSTRITIAGDGFWRMDAIGFRVSRDASLLGAGRARVWIAEASDGGGPLAATALGTLATTSTTVTTAAVESLASLNVVLQGGRSYWITLGSVPGDPDETRLRWYRSSIGSLGTTFSNDLLNTAGWGAAEGRAGGIKIGATAIPAPAAIALFTLVGRMPRRRRR